MAHFMTSLMTGVPRSSENCETGNGLPAGDCIQGQKQRYSDLNRNRRRIRRDQVNGAVPIIPPSSRRSFHQPPIGGARSFMVQPGYHGIVFRSNRFDGAVIHAGRRLYTDVTAAWSDSMHYPVGSGPTGLQPINVDDTTLPLNST